MTELGSQETLDGVASAVQSTNPMRKHDPMAQRCGARKKNGTPCQQYPMHGTMRCRLHGGASPQAQAKARERILAAADMAAKKLIEFMNDKRVPYPVRLSACRDLLDRAGLGARQAVDLSLEPAPWERLVTSIVSERPAEGEIVDAVLVDDGEDFYTPPAALPAAPTPARPPRPGAGRPRSVKARW